MMSINDRIRQVRQTLNLTQAAFGKRVAISTSYLAGMELGTKKINDRVIRLIAMEYGVDEHWLRTGEGAMYSEDIDVAIIKVTSLFKSLKPKYKECALIQLNALADLDGMEE